MPLGMHAHDHGRFATITFIGEVEDFQLFGLLHHGCLIQSFSNIIAIFDAGVMSAS
jgi:hypothetical protein